MAIIVKEEKKGIDLGMAAIVAVVVAALGMVIYYAFFSPTPLVDIPKPEGYEDVSRISKLRIDAEEIVNSRVWQSLKSKEGIPSLDIMITSRRTNPFEPINGSAETGRRTN